ncbi:MAG: 23S rRNA (guanosine(2251)-2'-O)-methyltransferase RlmB [Saprospiraceae bacterium]|nr:23S rRNA (guanosine(2251)-2'-O)-methyltransferase RlmB [Saprospiraceae bacterium]
MERIYGRNPVLEALRSEVGIDRVYIQDTISGEFEKEVRKLCKDREIPLNRVPKFKLDNEVKGNHQGIFAVSSLITYVALEDLLPQLIQSDINPVFILLDGVQDVRNIGAIARSAEVFGAHALVLPSKKSAPLNEIAIKTSSGALTHIPVCRVKNLASAIEFLSQHDVEILGADTEGDVALTDLDLTGPIAIVLGAEGQGIDRNLKIYFDHLFHIPQGGKTESLNVSVAAGIILYEIHKNRK